MKARTLTRREFCGHTCQALSVAALGGALTSMLQGCGNPASPSNVPALPRITAAVSGGASMLTIDAASPLASVGSAALVQGASGMLLVAHTAQDAFVAVTATCTHQQCTVTGFENQTYVCPCHGSRFDTGGRVVNGPASSSLRLFQTQFANGVLTISA
jgi:cytochrome b6-f complex iron-sulfur subunit